MTIRKRVMLLIDADNVSADVIEQAIDAVLAQHGAVHVRRAYCTAESALAHQQFFKRMSIRPIVNLSTGKNANDIALAVDGVDIALAERPDVAVIVSSDSDFAPLVIRLREKGCRVEGYGQLGKTSEDSKPVYDLFTDLPHRKSRGGDAPETRTPTRKSARTAAKRPAASPKAPARRAAAEPQARRPATEAAVIPAAPPPAASAPSSPAAPVSLPSPSAPLPAPPAPPASTQLPPEVRAILEQLPEVRAGDKIELRIAAERLRNADLLAKSGSSTRLFKKYPDLFMLTPERQPNKVQYIGPRQR